MYQQLPQMADFLKKVANKEYSDLKFFGAHTPSNHWIYFDIDGRPAIVVLRFDKPDGSKEFRPVTPSENGRISLKGLPGLRPLYRLPELVAHADRTVIITEGEKSADAAQILLPDCVCTTSLNGAKSAPKSDWSILENRDVWIWPDADEPGEEYAKDVKRLVEKAGAKSINIIDASALFGDDLQNGFDAANFLALGKKLPEQLPFLKTTLDLDEDNDNTVLRPYCFIKLSNGDVIGGRNTIDEERAPPGLYKVAVIESKNTGSSFAAPRWISQPFEILASCDNGSGYGFGITLRFVSIHGHVHVWTMSRALLAKESREMIANLLDMGFDIDVDSRACADFRRFLNRSRPELKALCVAIIGWVLNSYVLPDKIFGENAEEIFYQSDAPRRSPYTVSGSLEDWQKEVSIPIESFDIPVFFVSAAFASTLLTPFQIQTGGFHLYDSSSNGKTTAILWALSVWGNEKLMESWHGTSTGFETTAASRNDGVLPLDEIARADPREIGSVVYMLGNEAGKARGNAQLAQREVKRWTLMLLSSGEKTLSEIMQEGGQTPMAGQELRLINIRANAGDGCGILNGMADIDQRTDFIHKVTMATKRNNGHAIRHFLEHLTSPESILNVDAGRAQVETLAGSFAEGTTNPEIRRAALRFAVVAYGGELATQWGITGWAPGSATRAARALFERWLDDWGRHARRDESNFLNSFEEWLAACAQSNFAELKLNLEMTEAAKVRITTIKPFYGYYLDNSDHKVFYINSSGFSDMTRGTAKSTAIKALADAGMLVAADGKFGRGKLMRVGDKSINGRFVVVKVGADL